MLPGLFEVCNNSPIHQILLTHGEVDKIPSTRISSLKSKLLGPHTLWFDEQIVEFLRSNFTPEVLEAYQKVKPLAFKADLARYCILYVYGGWYFDLFVEVKNAEILDSFNAETNFIFFREVPVPPFGSIYAAVNTLFWVKDPGNPILKNVINECVKNIQAESYNNHPFDITGPMVFGREITKYQLLNDDYRFLMGECQLIDSKPSHMFTDVTMSDSVIFSQRRASTEDISSEVPTGYEMHPNNYYQMWFDRTVY
jgi:mannosyltransferase OCH1-like enzyme